MKLYNTLSRKKEDFETLKKGEVSMYVCGPTVYGPPHAGHAKTYINFDLVYRFLEFLGYKVKLIKNITDVGHIVGDADTGEDKISKQAKKENLDPWKIARKYEEQFYDEMDKLNVRRAQFEPRATEFIDTMLKMTQALVKNGFAYATPRGNVYFDVTKFPNYGNLSGRKLDETLEATRVEGEEDKKQPQDFALWKSAAPDHIMQWPSPWGQGYPGWHIECSAMALDLIGEQIDIHGGGLDNMFPHHECEIAQSEAYTGKQFSKFFMHNNLVTVEGQKMGKSLGNFVNICDLLKEFSPQVIRFFILKFHYRSQVDFSRDAMRLAEKEWNKINDAFMKAISETEGLYEGETLESLETEEIKKIYKEVVEALSDDFNTPIAIAKMIELSKLSNQSISEMKKDETVEEAVNRLIDIVTMAKHFFEPVFGFKFQKEEV
ncbi:MAG: cysteine--tRNA ligase, partial [Firmicutes bacterium]|nr:cysteine--tRNA ligase [Bacillota bacterium]